MKAIRAARASKVEALRASQNPTLLPQQPLPLLSVGAHEVAPSSGHKRPRLDTEDSLEENLVQEIVTSMEVDQQVCSILSSLSNFFEIFSTLLDESAACVDLLLKGLLDRASLQLPEESYLTPSTSSFHFHFCFLHFFCIIILCISICPSTVCAFPASNSGPVSSSLRIMSINANGLSNPMKLNAIQDMVHNSQPHILVVGETKNANEVESRLHLPGYDSFENPGRPNGHQSGKWGVIIAVRRGFFTVQHLPMTDALRGRAVALDPVIPTTNAAAFSHRFIGIYAPWNPGGTEDDEHLFWPEITTLASSAKFSWSMAGDFNATLSHLESTSTNFSISPARLKYSQFLQDTDAVDVWQCQPNTAASPSFFTCKSQLTTVSEPTFSIIDRVAASCTGTLTAEISLIPHFVPCTDHRPIFSRIILSSPSLIPGEPDIPHEVPATAYSPRFRVPFRHEKYRFHLFSASVDEALTKASDTLHADVSSDSDFQSQYSLLTDILLSSASSSFRPPSSTRRSHKITNPTIKLIITELRRINRLLSALSLTRAHTVLQLPLAPWVNNYVSAFLAQAPSPTDTINDFPLHFRTFLSDIRWKLHKIRFAEERNERQSQLTKTARFRIRLTLGGGSCKRLYPHSFSSLPLALTPFPDSQPDHVITGPDAVKSATVAYFQKLYHQTGRTHQQKPWLTSPSVTDIRVSTSSDPFQWPVLLSLKDLRALLSRGNSRPTPGPDGWEKWFLRYLSDDALSIILKLINHILSHSHVPDCIKPTNLSTIHKRGPNTYLSNYRGVACNNCLLNLPFAWLNYRITPYLTHHRIIPECQVATQPGTQGRDLISYISQIELWAARENVPLYILQRDQRKGFDMLEPEGFYDAITAYGLPSSIIDLDRSAQDSVPYQVKTAYGLTDSFIVSGVTKQGGSLSPLKCTLTTSLCSRWLMDLDRQGTLTIQTHQSRIAKPHTPSDDLSLHVSMIEAMDDTLIMRHSLTALKFSARCADRFQATYGWETEWRKSALYTFNTPTPQGDDALMPSVDYTNPQAAVTFWHHVPIIQDHITFLRVPINQPHKQFLSLRDIISNFKFPLLSSHLPLTLLRRIISQSVISKLRPHLALQPISPANATTLDKMLATKIHTHLGFPFRFNTVLLTTPLELRGLGFPSISRLNSSLAVSGLQRDLTHHIPSFRTMAQITLADWACGSNNCLNPLSCHSRLPPCHPHHLPSAWSIALSTLFSLQLSLIPTDLSFIILGNVSLRHLHSQFHNLYPDFPTLPSRTLSNFEKHGFTLLKHFGSFSPLTRFSSFPSFIPFFLQFPSHQYYLTRDWPLLTNWFAFIPLLLRHTCLPNPSMLFSPSHRKTVAENSILALSKTLTHSSSYSHPSRHTDLLATDGSMVLHPLSGRKSVTFAVASNGNVFSASLPPGSRDTGTLHGEVYAIVAASLLSLHRPHHPQPHIISDHLNSVNLLHSLPPPLRLFNHPARALYRWVLDIWSRSPTAPTISHVRAHTDARDIKSNLNRLVDFVASSSQHLPLPPPSVPVPSFFMDNFMIFSSSHGFIESSIFCYVDSLLAKTQAASLNTCHEPLPPLPLFDETPPPTYPYTKSPSSYSAVIQLYARSGQLDTTLHLASRLKEGFQPWCCFGCQQIEDPHHIFVRCPRFASLRDSYTQRLKSGVLTILDTYDPPEQDLSFIIEQVSNLFIDSSVWPSRQAGYYLGILPRLVPAPHTASIMHSRLAHHAHTISIQLASHIWGLVRRTARDHATCQRQQQPHQRVLSLPPQLSTLFHTLVYPSFSLVFA